MASRYLLDTSALYPLVLRIRENLLKHSSLFTVLDLTIYEVEVGKRRMEGASQGQNKGLYDSSQTLPGDL